MGGPVEFGGTSAARCLGAFVTVRATVAALWVDWPQVQLFNLGECFTWLSASPLGCFARLGLRADASLPLAADTASRWHR